MGSHEFTIEEQAQHIIWIVEGNGFMDYSTVILNQISEISTSEQ